MRKISILLFTVYCLLFTVLLVPSVLAIGSTKSATTKETTPAGKLKEERQEQINDLKERVATRVAELREKLRRAWSGEIKSISGTTITLTTKEGDKSVLTTEETIFLRIGAGGRKKITLADLVVGEKIVAFGQFDEEKKTLTGKIVLAKVFPININGKVTAVDTNNATITVGSLKRGSFVVDVESTTKILVWEKGKGLQTSGLSKIKVGDRVHVNGTSPTKPKEGENRLTANRILVLPGKAIGIVGSPTPSASPKTSPSSSVSPSPTASPAE